MCHRTAGSLLSHPGWLGVAGRALTDGAPVAHLGPPKTPPAGVYVLKPGLWMAVLSSDWVCCARRFDGSAWKDVAAAFALGMVF